MDLIRFSESQKILRSVCESLHPSSENVPVRSALQRILFDAIHAVHSNPPYAVAAMDGIAVQWKVLRQYPVTLKQNEWQRVNTGEQLSSNWDAVIRIEDVEWENGSPLIERKVEPFQNIRLRSEDFEEGQLLLSANHRLEPQDLSLLLAAGIDRVRVFRKPVITFMPTGSELVMENSTAGSGGVIESNSAMIAGMVDAWGGLFRTTEIIPDDQESLTSALRTNLAQSDILIVSAGTSMGTRDLTAVVLEEMGSVLFHGVAMNPAKPLVLAKIGDVPVVGLPGYPVAAYVASLFYLREMVCSLSGVQSDQRKEVYISAEELPPKEFDTFYRVNVFDVDGRIYVRKIARGASSLFSLAQLDGLMHVPPNTSIQKRDAVRVDVIHDRASRTLAIRGSIDPALQKLFDLFQTTMPDYRILSWECPEDAALQNIVERNCHIAVVNTFDGHDLFPGFARQLQDNMLRYRVFTSRAGLLLNRTIHQTNTLHDLPEGIRIVVPAKLSELWKQFVASNSISNSQFEIIDVKTSEKPFVEAIDSNSWDAIFADIRFLKSSQVAAAEICSHLDLIVSEGYLSFPPIKKLIDLLLSQTYGEWLKTNKGFDISSRSLLQETYDLL